MASNLERSENEYDFLQNVNKTRRRETLYNGVFWLTALCLGVMCILQASLNIILRLHSNPEAETDLQNTSIYNLTIDELRTRFDILIKERDHLQGIYTSVAEEKNQFQTLYNNMTNERDQLKKKTDQHKRSFPKLVDMIRSGWKYFHNSLYFISTEKKSWAWSRTECLRNGADLVIINSQEEKDFITEQLGNNSLAWVGLRSMDTDGTWEWVDKTALNTLYWTIPNSENEAGNMSAEHTWITMPCVQEERWVCERTVFE